TYNHSTGTVTGQAITGGVFYSPSSAYSFPSDYANDYFFGDYVADWIKRIDLTTNQVTSFADSAGAPVDLRVLPDGTLLYLSRDAISFGSGRVYRVSYTVNQSPYIGVPPASQVRAVDQSVTFNVVPGGTGPFTFQWQRNNMDIMGATGQSYTL